MVVDGFVGTVSLADLTGALVPAAAGPFVLGRVQLQATIPELVAADRITATDGAGRAGSSEPFDAVAGPPMAVVFPRRSVESPAGGCSPPVDLELRDVLGHPAATELDVTARLQSAPPGVGFFSDDACTAPLQALTVPAGASRTSFHFRAGAAGLVTLRAVPATLPSASQDQTVSP
jgi:hypothetical protein